MRNYQELILNLKKHKLIKNNLNELKRDNIYQLMVSMSDRMDKLEEFISEETEYDGTKVHKAKYGSDKTKWLK